MGVTPRQDQALRFAPTSTTWLPTTKSSTSSPRPTPCSTTNGHFLEEEVEVREGQKFEFTHPENIDFMDVSPKQILSTATSLIPFLEHDDAPRALMGSNMQRQAVPLLRPERPLVGTGTERQIAVDSGQVDRCATAMASSQTPTHAASP